MTNQEKLDLLNSLDVVDFSCNNEECEYILVARNDETKAVFAQIGVPDEWFLSGDDEDTVDVSLVGFELCRATWFDQINGFQLERRDETDGEATQAAGTDENG